LVLWAIAGLIRPYRAPVSLSKKNKSYRYYIRKGSTTVVAQNQDERELLSMAAMVPFDDRANNAAEIDALDLGLIREYLKQVRSALFTEAATMEFLELCRCVNLVFGPKEHMRPKNVGLMFFNTEPRKYFPYTQIDIVHFPQGLGAETFTEKIFKGPVHIMLKDALNYIESQVIKERIHKRSDRPEADRFYNYAFEALKEALCNAIYHRSYETRDPVEVRILPDSITINSFPGPDRSISDKDIQAFKLVSRWYRNRRIGEFLKELELTEGRGTGIPRMLKALKRNESPLPIFHTDENRTYLTVEFPLHPLFLEDAVEEDKTGQAPIKYRTSTAQVPHKSQVLEFCTEPRSFKDIMNQLGLKHRVYVLKEYIQPLVEEGLLALTIPDKPRSSRQKYLTTEQGRNSLEGKHLVE